MTDRIADIPPLERKDGIILFLSRINEIERTVVLNRSERSCRLQLEPRERPLSREIPRGRLVKIFAYARTEESSFHGRSTDRERPLIGTPRSSHPLASLGILWPLIISELASNNHRHAMHPSTKLESSRTTAASIIDLTNRERTFLGPIPFTRSRIHIRSTKNYQSDQRRGHRLPLHFHLYLYHSNSPPPLPPPSSHGRSVDYEPDTHVSRVSSPPPPPSSFLFSFFPFFSTRHTVRVHEATERG